MSRALRDGAPTLKRLQLIKQCCLQLIDLFVALEHETFWLNQMGKWEAEIIHRSGSVEAGWVWKIGEGMQVITEAVLSRDKEILASSMNGCQMEEGGTLKYNMPGVLERRSEQGCQTLQW